MEKRFTFESKADRLKLHAWLIEPNGEKKGIIQILHGMCEYKERYEEFMRFFASHGYVAVCHDHRGHGDSVKDEADLGYFYDKTGKAIVDDAAQLTEFLKVEYPNLPVILFGHSMGSMVARCYLRDYDYLIDKAIICGSPSANPFCGAGIFLAKLISALRGDRHRSKLLAYLSTGKGAKRFEHEGVGAWLTHDRNCIEKFYQNPKGKHKFTCNGYENLLCLMKTTYTKEGYQVRKPNLPIHFVSGSEDAVLGGELQWMKSVETSRDVGYQSVTGKLYEGLRHEIFNDIGKEEVYQDLLEFIEKA